MSSSSPIFRASTQPTATSLPLCQIPFRRSVAPAGRRFFKNTFSKSESREARRARCRAAGAGPPFRRAVSGSSGRRRGERDDSDRGHGLHGNRYRLLCGPGVFHGGFEVEIQVSSGGDGEIDAVRRCGGERCGVGCSGEFKGFVQRIDRRRKIAHARRFRSEKPHQ